MGEEVLIKFRNESSVKDPTYDGNGMDLCACEEHIVYPGRWRIISTGLFFIVPEGYELQIRPRSGLAAKFGITILNTPGIIASDYEDVCKVILFNCGVIPFNVSPGTKIARMSISPVVGARLVKTE